MRGRPYEQRAAGEAWWASAFRRRSEIVGYEHGVYANARQSRQTLSSAVSTRGIRCLARLMTSTRFHTHVKFAR